MSRLPEIVLREGFGIEADWISAAWIGVGITLWLLGAQMAVLRPLRSYFLVMTFVATLSAIDQVIRGSAAWDALVSADAHAMTALLSERLLLVIFAIILIAFLIASGTSRREAYLVVGSMSAPSSIRLPGRHGVPLVHRRTDRICRARLSDCRPGVLDFAGCGSGRGRIVCALGGSYRGRFELIRRGGLVSSRPLVKVGVGDWRS
jgi:hypothetical protein